MADMHIWYSIAVIAVITALLRFLPFIIFNGKMKTPKIVDKLSKILPCAVMGMLVVYCLKDVSFESTAAYLPAAVASLTVVLLHVWRRNTLLSIIGGTLCYMALVQFVF